MNLNNKRCPQKQMSSCLIKIQDSIKYFNKKMVLCCYFASQKIYSRSPAFTIKEFYQNQRTQLAAGIAAGEENKKLNSQIQFRFLFDF